MNNSNCPNCGSDFYRNVTTKRNNCLGLCDPCRTKNRNDKRKISSIYGRGPGPDFMPSMQTI